MSLFFISAAVPGMAWIATLNGGDVAAFVSILIFEYTCLFLHLMYSHITICYVNVSLQVNGYLPVVLLLMLISILPFMFYGVARHYEDRKTESDVQKSIIGRYFYYQVSHRSNDIEGYFSFRQSNILANPHNQLANIFITVTAGSILDSLGEIVEHPGNMLAILGKSLPNVVGYFATFIMTKILAGLPLILLRFGPLIRLAFIKLCFREKYMTQAEIDEAYFPKVFSQVNYNNCDVNCHALLFSFLSFFFL